MDKTLQAKFGAFLGMASAEAAKPVEESAWADMARQVMAVMGERDPDARARMISETDLSKWDGSEECDVRQRR